MIKVLIIWIVIILSFIITGIYHGRTCKIDNCPAKKWFKQ